MINKGAFEGLDACMMSHPAPADVVYCTILSVGGMTVEYFGKASHASASPWEGKTRKWIVKYYFLRISYSTEHIAHFFLSMF